MKEQILYRELAKYYDLIYSKKDYKGEAEKVASLIQKYKKSDGKELLDVACGSGNHLKYLQKKFICTGLDINSQMINIAKVKAKKAIFIKSDMAKMSLGKQFDVLICMFSAIGYVKTYSALQKTIVNFSRHLKKGGVLLIQPWLTMSSFHAGLPHMETYDGKDIKVARLSISKIMSGYSVVDMHYLIAEKDQDVRCFKDRHVLGLFETGRVLRLMGNAGLRAIFLKKEFGNRGVYLGIKE